jgi:CRP-like cAMP-binding protein
MTLQSALLGLPKDGPEQQAIEAGEVDAILDYSNSNVILFPAARRALHAGAVRTSAALRAPLANSLLAALPSAEYRHVLVGLEPVTLQLGEVLHEPAAAIRYVYFPVGCVVCLTTTVAGHKAVEVGLVGYEGMVGLALVLGDGASSVRAVVAARGVALRMEATRFRKTFLQCLSLQQELHRYTYAMLAHARQTIACNCFHLSDARIARWLLMASDRAQSPELFLTQSLVANMLGLRRVTVTETVGRLWHRKLIGYGRGWIRILDRPGLQAAACACYAGIEGQQSSR